MIRLLTSIFNRLSEILNPLEEIRASQRRIESKMDANTKILLAIQDEVTLREAVKLDLIASPVTEQS